MNGIAYPKEFKLFIVENPHMKVEELCKVAREQFGIEGVTGSKIRNLKYSTLQTFRRMNNKKCPFYMYAADEFGEITYTGAASNWMYAYRSVRRRLLNNKNDVAYINCNETGHRIGFYFDTESNSIEMDSIEDI